MLELDVLGQAHPLQTDASIRPTVLIGLGGVGKEVLIRIRRLFYERYDTVGLPITQYLWFDTDAQRGNIHRQADDEIDRPLFLKSDERVIGKIEPAQLVEYYRQCDRFKWFNRDALEILGTSVFTQGTRGIRPFGRLAFFHSYPKLRTALEQKIRQIGPDAQQMTSQMGYPVDNTLEVVIVTSLAGGTGSGSFIDVAFLAKALAPEAMITGLLFLPQVFEGDAVVAHEVVKANSYAALKELDYYLTGKASEQTPLYFEVEWDNTPHRIPGPPFTTVYLIEDESHLGARTEDSTDPFQMAAEFLALDFEDSPFAAAKRSHRANMEPFLHTETQYSVYDSAGDKRLYVQYASNRYAAFGLSQIQLNQPRIARAAAYKLGEYLVQFWLTDGEVEREFAVNASQSTGGMDVRQRFRTLGLTSDQLVSDVLAGAFGEPDQRAIENQFRAITAKITQKQREIDEILNDPRNVFPSDEDGTDISPRLNREILELEAFVAEIQHETENLNITLKAFFESNLQEHGTIGPHIRALQANKARMERELEEAVEEMMLGLLCNPVSHGKSDAAAFLDAGQNGMHQLIQEVQGQMALNAEAIDQSDSQPRPTFRVEVKSDFAKYRAYLRQARRIPIWAGFLFPRHARSIATKYYEQKLESAIEAHFRNNLRALEGFVNERRDVLKSHIENRYRGEALKRLANSQQTGLLNRLYARLGSRTETTDPDGTKAIKASGLQQLLDTFTRSLIELRDGFRQMAATYQQTPSSPRNLNLPLNFNMAEEVGKFLAPRLHVTDGIEMLTRLSNEFFVGCGFVRGSENQPGAVGEIEGLREIYRRAIRRASHPGEWEQIRESLEAFVLDKMKDLKISDTAVSHLHNHLDDAGEIQRALTALVEMGAVRIQRPELPLMEFGQVRSLSIIGISDTDHPLCAHIRNLNTVAENPYQQASALACPNDSIRFFTERIAFPVFYAGGLRDLRDSYIANIRRNPNHVYWRHFEQNYQKYRDILPPSNAAEALGIIESYQLVLESLILGNLSEAPSGERFYLRGLERHQAPGATIQESANRLRAAPEISDRLTQSNRLVLDQWDGDERIDKHFQLLRLYNYLLETVYPDDRQTVILGESIPVMNLYHIVASTLYQRQWNEVKRRTGWTDEHIRARLDSDDALDTFSDTLEYREAEMRGPFRVLRHTGG